MYIVAAIGLMTMILSLIMAVSPAGWSRGIVRFADKPYFHIFEIVTRLLLGGSLLFFSSQTRFPLFIAVVGCMFLFAGVVLIVVGEKRHRRFAVRSASFTNIFRPAGVAGIAFGAFVIYAGVA